MIHCGRPTKSGNPCKAIGFGYSSVCKIHETDYDRQLTQAFQEGIKNGESRAQQSREWELENLIRAEVDRRMAETPCKHWRFKDIEGRQIVTIGNYSYIWNGDTELKIGDEVMLPSSEWYPRRSANVTGIGTDYAGHLVVLNELVNS